MLIRCSQLGLLMTNPKSKTEALSETAKSMIKDIVREEFFGVRKQISSKAMEKGIRCEDDSITLLNSVLFKSYVKHIGRVSNEFITGECDILADTHGRDVKTSWSIDTFPLFDDELKNNAYEWQMRGYMWIYDKPEWFVDYCLVDTPSDLIGYEQEELHQVSHIDDDLRVRTVKHLRDVALEDAIKEKVIAARIYAESLRSALVN